MPQHCCCVWHRFTKNQMHLRQHLYLYALLAARIRYGYVGIILLQETQRLMNEPVPGIQAVPDESNARYFKVVVAGPKDVSTVGNTDL